MPQQLCRYLDICSVVSTLRDDFQIVPAKLIKNGFLEIVSQGRTKLVFVDATEDSNQGSTRDVGRDKLMRWIRTTTTNDKYLYTAFRCFKIP